MIGELFFRCQSQADESVLFSLIQLGKGNGIKASADYQKPLIQSGLPGRFGVFQPQQAGQDSRKACASGQRVQLAVLPEHLAGLADVLHGLGVIDLNARAGQPDRLSRFCDHGGKLALFRNDGGHVGVSHWLEGILPEHALGHRHSFNELLTVLCGPVHLGKGRHEEQLPFWALLCHCFQLGSDVAPERGIRLFL